MTSIFIPNSFSAWCARKGKKLALALFIASMAAQAQIPTGKKKADSDEEKIKRDPLISNISRSANTLTDEALKRADQPGHMLAAESKPGEVYSIVIEGAKKIEPDAVAYQLNSRVGQAIVPADVQADIRQIYGMGLFLDISVEKTVNEDGSLTLTYKLIEKPTIGQIKFKGNEFIDDTDLKSVVDLQPYFVADIPRIIKNVAQIKKKYIDKGYYLVDVDYELLPSEAGPAEESTEGKKRSKIAETSVSALDFVDVVFNISENAKVSIESVSFLGNENISSDNLKSVMRTKERHPLSILTGWGNYDEQAFKIDKMLVEQYYQEHGYLNVQVGNAKVEMSPDLKRLRIVVPVKEGLQYRLGKLDIIGDFVETDAEEVQEKQALGEASFLKSDLLSKIKLAPGEVFNRTAFGRDLIEISDEYQNEGYAYVNPTPMTSVNEENQTIDVQLVIEAGPRVTVERIDISGNVKTTDDVIRREVRLYEGELFSSSMLRLSEQRINQLGYFEDVVVMTKPGSKPDLIIVDISLKERNSGTINFGAGYGTGGESIVLQGQVSQHNLFGRGQTLSLQVQWSRFRRIFEIQFLDPYITTLGGEPLVFSVSAYNTQRALGSFSRSSSGGDLMLGYPIGKPLSGLSRRWQKQSSQFFESYVPDFENLFFYLSYKAERVEITGDDFGIRFFGLRKREPHYTTSIGPFLQFDQRNNRLAPTKGFVVDLRTQLASSYFGAGGLTYLENQIIENSENKGLDAGSWFRDSKAVSNNFFQLNTSARLYFDLNLDFLKGVIAKVNISMGYMDTFGKLLIAENYFVGSQNTVRGYYLRSIGPVVDLSRLRPDKPLMDFIVGGSKQFLTNFELEFPVVRPIGLSGVLFLDFGNVYASDENYFYIGGPSKKYEKVEPYDPLGIYALTGLYGSFGFGLRWASPMGLLRFEWGIPLTPRRPGTPGRLEGDQPILFEFGMGQSF